MSGFRFSSKMRQAVDRCRFGFASTSSSFKRKFSSNSTGDVNNVQSAWKRFTAPRPEYKRYTKDWWVDKSIVMVVFACTGSSTAYIVRPFISNYLQLEGSFKEGPWSYRIVSLVAMMPIYSVLLVSFGTVFGRHAYFKKFAKNMWTRMFFMNKKK
mmetsp:Transcript_17510/g.30631  ORF Transcript_17510/g.30631 Transcript_17510/m.30631 type:complete len:155 (+) Transcript_17510:104-568(+)